MSCWHHSLAASASRPTRPQPTTWCIIRSLAKQAARDRPASTSRCAHAPSSPPEGAIRRRRA
eukprot:6168070-Prymnesium_polylepis.1